MKKHKLIVILFVAMNQSIGSAFPGIPNSSFVQSSSENFDGDENSEETPHPFTWQECMIVLNKPHIPLETINCCLPSVCPILQRPEYSYIAKSLLKICNGTYIAKTSIECCIRRKPSGVNTSANFNNHFNKENCSFLDGGGNFGKLSVNDPIALIKFNNTDIQNESGDM
ncbi:hypothetical protein JTB14_026549 [Gonioctena quinquepunctata]|nr:hypothetical protein JTB14_026549 [Gonioctena quinquepunctata]